MQGIDPLERDTGVRQRNASPEIAAEPSVGSDPAPPDGDFTAFYRAQYERQVRRAFLLSGSVTAASDIVSEAFTSVYRRWGTLDDPALYLNRCVVNGCRDWGRRRTRWSRLIAPGRPETLDEAGSGSGHGSLGGGTDRGFAAVDLADALARLPHRQRVAIVLRFYGRESERSIAELLDCRPGTVGSLIHRGLARLRRDLVESPLERPEEESR